VISFEEAEFGIEINCLVGGLGQDCVIAKCSVACLIVVMVFTFFVAANVAVPIVLVRVTVVMMPRCMTIPPVLQLIIILLN